MDLFEEARAFLETNPPYSKTKANKHGSLWREGQQYDVQILDDVIAFNASLVQVLINLAKVTIECLILPIEEDGGQVKPDSGAFHLTARVKTKDTLLDKLRRMETTPLLNIQDIAGIRFDCDLTLDEQRSVAEVFRKGFLDGGATRVDIRDYLDEPHSGYRAIHLHIRAKAGRAELQIRTALQSKWANVYEEAGDIFGRDIRYLHEGAQVPPGAEEIVRELHQASEFVREVEISSNSPTSTRNSDTRQRRAEAYEILDRIHDKLSDVRNQNLM